MRADDIRSLVAYNYWATWQIFAAAREISAAQFTAEGVITYRGRGATLAHTLDVEQSWRRRLQGMDKAIWDAELAADQFATPADLEAAWRADAAEMTAWIAGMDDERLADTVDLGPKDRFPLWVFLVHIVTHGIEQRRDAALLLRQFGTEPPQLEFLWYADSQLTELGIQR